MKYHISFSGGMGSAVSALIALEHNMDFTLLFADTLIEDADLYRFNNDVARVCQREVITLTDGRTPWDVYIDRKWIGNSRTAHCSTELKTKQVKAWLDENAKPDDPLVLGMDMSELDRIERAQKQWEPRPVVSLLNRYHVWRPQYDEILKRHGIEKPRLYGQGYEHNNCFHGDTRFITSEGIKTFRECVGREVSVLGRNNGWKMARVECFGVQELVELTVSRYGRTKTILTTKDHRWFVRQTRDRTEELLTRDLPAGKRLVGAHGRLSAMVRPSAFGVAHGIVFGDGTAVAGTWNNPATVTLCGEKDRQLLRWFPNSPTAEVPGVGIQVKDLPRVWKKKPDMAESQSYLYGWLAGYFAADGSVSGGEATISSAKRENLELVNDVCAKLGISTSPIRTESRLGFGKELSDLYAIALSPGTLREDFFLIDAHKARFLASNRKRPAEWTIDSVRTTGQSEEVFCAVVPDGRAFALEDNILTGNCGGFCCKAGLVQFERLYRTNPERYQQHEREMERAMQAIGPTAKPFLKRTRNGVVEYLTLRQFREELEAGTMELPMFSEAGCGCFTDEAA